MRANHYFAIFNLPVSFDIDSNALAHQYRELQRTIHPDKFADAPEQERLLALQHASQINAAYQTLKNPLSRAQYLLHLQDDTAEANDPLLQMDSEFLMEQMELREILAEITQLNALNHFLDQIEQKIQQILASLAVQFQHADYTAARNTVKKLQFFDKLHKEILSLEEQLAC